MTYKAILILFFPLLFLSCSEEIQKKDFNFTLDEACMIVNYQQDNTIEGDYILVEKRIEKQSIIYIKTPENFQINNSNIKDWVVGWGTDTPLYDAGVENIRSIESIDFKTGKITLGDIKRGAGFPKLNQRIVFWNTKPSGFFNYNQKAIITPDIWPEFSGKSIAFSSIEYDPILKKWIMIVHECDTSSVQIYAAVSDNLIDWKAANNGLPILKASDFKNCKWAGKDVTGKTPQTPYVSDIIYHDKKWHLFMDGYSSDGKRHIGIATSETSLLGPFKISNDPILSPGDKRSWDNEFVFYAKVKKYKDGFIMFYDGRNSKGYEQVGMSFSKDLLSWNKSPHNPVIDQHSGWRSFIGSSEPNHIEIRKDSIILMIAGVKKFKMGFWHNYITKQMYKDKSGNVDDAQLGVYLSTDEGKNFYAHKNNPVFTNNYGIKYKMSIWEAIINSLKQILLI